jgi:hypothetical protein
LWNYGPQSYGSPLSMFTGCYSCKVVDGQKLNNPMMLPKFLVDGGLKWNGFMARKKLSLIWSTNKIPLGREYKSLQGHQGQSQFTSSHKFIFSPMFITFVTLCTLEWDKYVGK